MPAPDTTHPSPPHGGGWGKLFLGLAAGILLSGAYIRLNWTLPAWMQLPGLVQSLGPRTVADTVLEDPQASLDAKQRAVEELFRHDPGLFRELDDALGHGITQAVLDQKARHHLQLFQAKQTTLRSSLEKQDSLREAALRQHQAADLDTLLLRMGVQDLRSDPFLHAYLQQRFPGIREEDVLRETLAIKPDDLFPATP